MPHIYVAPWAIAPINGIDGYVPPVALGHIGTLDLRSNTLCSRINAAEPGYGIFVYDRLTATGGYYLGADPQALLSLSQRNAIANATGKAVGAGSFQDTIRDQFLNPLKYDPTGVNFHKPLRGNVRNGARLYLGGFGSLVSERCTESHEAVQASLAVRWADYRRLRGEGLPLELLQKWTGYDSLKLFGRRPNGNDLDRLLPPEHLADGWQMPATTLGDTFVEATTDTNLESHTPTGANAATGWTLVQGSAGDLIVRQATDRVETNSFNFNRYRIDDDLSSPDHYAQVDMDCSTDATGASIFVCTRMHNGATNTMYFGGFDGWNGDALVLRKIIAGTPTTLANKTYAVTAGTPVTVKLESDSSDNHRIYVNGTLELGPSTDTSETANLRTGLRALKVTDGFIVYGTYVSADLAVAGLANSQAVIIG